MASHLTQPPGTDGRSREHEPTARALDSITDGLITLDAEWRYTYVNSAAERQLGQAAGELLGKRVWRPDHPDDTVESTVVAMPTVRIQVATVADSRVKIRKTTTDATPSRRSSRAWQRQRPAARLSSQQVPAAAGIG